MKDRCIDDVAIHHSFLSRNYRKGSQFECNYFLPFKVWHRAWLSTGTQQRHSGKMNPHAPLLEPFERIGLRFSSANISWRGFFRRDNKLFSPRGLPTEEAMTRSAKVITGATNSVVIFRLLNFSYLIHTCYLNTFFCWVRYVPDEVWKKFPEDGNLNCFGLGLSLRNENKLWES